MRDADVISWRIRRCQKSTMQKPQQPTHAERQKVFESIFGTVRADSGGTGMGSTDKERDETLRRVSFDTLPASVAPFELPDPEAKLKAKHASLMDDELSLPTQAKPLVLDEKTKTFCQIFDHVTPGQSVAYGGQSVQPDGEVPFEQLPKKAAEALPDVRPKVPERDFLKEEMEERERHAREKPVRTPSARYSEAHDKYVKIFGDVEDQS